MKAKKIPMRMCVGCREMKPKKELMRVVRSAQGEVALDDKGKVPGRGAYVCAREQCLSNAVKTRALERALQTRLTPDVEAALRGTLAERTNE